MLPFPLLDSFVANVFFKLTPNKFAIRWVRIQPSYPEIEPRIQRQAIECGTDSLRESVFHDVVHDLEWTRRTIIRSAHPVQVVAFGRAGLVAAKE